MSVTIRPVIEADCRQMPAFRREMEGGAFLSELRDEAYYRYKYLAAGLAFAAVEGDRVVGVTAATPKRVRLPEGIVDAGEMGDLFVRPDHRGRGLFRELHDAVAGALRERGAVLATVRAGRGASDHMRKAFGYRELFRVAESVAALTEEGRRGLPLGRVPLLNRLLPRVRWRDGAPAGARVSVVPIEDLPPSRGGDRAGTVRDEARIRLRYGEDPSPYEAIALFVDDRAAGGAVILVYGGKGFLVDLFCDSGDPSACDLLVAGALRRMADAGAKVAHFWSAAGSREDAVRRAGLRVLRKRKAVLARGLGDAAPDLPAPSGWCFRMGDTDGI
jgi:GNAT superfamily N-acetyltransferase